MTPEPEISGPTESTLDSAAIFPLLSGEGDQRLLLEWVEGHEEYTLVDPTEPVETAEFDCCILDGRALEEHAETLRERKQKADPVLLPCLLLLPGADLSVIEADQGEIADGVLFETVDEVVSMPIRKIELEWRTKALLRLRAQSLRLEKNREQLRLFKQATESAGHGVYIADRDGVITYVNPAFEEMTGYDSSEIIGETPALLDSGEMSGDYFDQLWETIQGGDVWDENIVNRRKDGELYHAHQTIAPVLDETDRPSKFVAIQSEITEQVETQQRLELFRDIVERLDDPIMLQDRDGQFRLVNEALVGYTGMSREELLGETEHAFMDEESAARIQAHKRDVLETEQPVRYSISPEFPTQDKDTFSTVRFPYYEDGTLAGTIAICRTVTELKSRENQLEVIDRVLRHNLRNHMTTVGMAAEGIRARASGDIAESAEQILKTSRKVNETVEKERELTKFLIEDRDERSIDLVNTVETIVRRQAENHPAADISVDLPETCTIKATVAFGDAITELVENALIHTDKDTPSVHVAVTDETDRTTITVADNGPEIPEMDRKVLTHGTTIDQLFHGSGLGLWLVHLIVTRTGGTVTLEENSPTGNIVSIELPQLATKR